MFVSVAKTAAAAFIVGSAFLVSATGAHAGMMAQETLEQAQDQCAQMMKGQRAFCMINAQNQYKADMAMEQKKDVTVHYDYDASNDTPAQSKAKETFAQAAEKCAELAKGQRSFCMIDAQNKYEGGMGW
jgi:hypothetical protein